MLAWFKKIDIGLECIDSPESINTDDNESDDSDDNDFNHRCIDSNNEKWEKNDDKNNIKFNYNKKYGINEYGFFNLYLLNSFLLNWFLLYWFLLYWVFEY